MTLEIGDRVGHYHVTALIGEGGMGRVYRATDTKLHRDVALKILPESDEQRLARFEREAQVLASLNHPGIASIYGIEERHDGRALVMELVEGDTLSTVIANQGTGALPVAEVVRLALEIADALEAAHERGIIHRDLKPSNIKVTPAGRVKILDFGLAKALDGASVASRLGDSTATSESTGHGVILGTAAYMSPEQARGQASDRRTDVWAFGAVLYELLTGRAPFEGATPIDLIAAVLHHEPDFTRLPAEAGPGLRAVVTRCLDKRLDHRLRDIGDVRVMLREVDAAVARSAVVSDDGETELPGDRVSRPLWGLAAGAAFVLALVVVWNLTRDAGGPPPAVNRFEVSVAEIGDLGRTTGQMLAIAPDGSQIAFVAGSALYVRHLDALEPTLVTGSQGAEAPFFSPESDWLGFWSDGSIRKVPTAGGIPRRVADIERPWGASWSRDGRVMIGQGPEGIWSVSSEGGVPTQVVSIDEGFAYGPSVLADGSILFTRSASGAAGRQWEDAAIVLVPPGGDPIEVHTGGSAARVLSTGHLVFVREGQILAANFDLGRRAMVGLPIAVAEGVRQAPPLFQGTAHFAVSDTGTLAFVPGTPAVRAPPRQLMLVDRQGLGRELPLDRRAFYLPRFSPDGTRLAIDVSDEGRDIWLFDLERQATRRLTLQPGADSYPVWTPQGDALILGADPEGGVRNLYLQPVDGSSLARRLTESPSVQLPETMSPDGLLVLSTVTLPGGESNFALFDIHGVDPPRLLEATPFLERAPAISPDGQWIAYASDETGRFEIWLRRFPSYDEKRQVTYGGGHWPSWSPTRNELYFIRDRTRMMAMEYEVGETLQIDPAVQLFEGPFYTGTGRTYDVAPGGDQFVMVYRTQEDRRSELSVVLNWFEELNAQVPLD